MKPVERPGVRRGYDLWAKQYDQAANPLVHLERRHTMQALQPQAGERILDAGCGTGSHLQALQRQGVQAVGVDFSEGMLGVAAATAATITAGTTGTTDTTDTAGITDTTATTGNPNLRLVVGDLHAPLPFHSEVFDAFLCSLVSEHLQQLDVLFVEAHRTLLPGGRLVFSAFHPALAAAGVEANFEMAGVEYRLGAEPHTTEAFCEAIRDAGFTQLCVAEFTGDEAMVAAVPGSRKYLGRPLLLLLTARRSL